MHLSAPFIKKPVMTTLLMVAIVAIGIASYLKLPVSSMPDVSFPFITVKVDYPGASPETMANNVATPLEEQFLTISGLLTVSSQNTLGSSSIVLQFDYSKDIDSATIDVQSAISRALPLLPRDLPSAPTYKKVNPSEVPIIYFALISETMPLAEMYDYANNFIAQRFALIEGVAEVKTYGSPYAVRVQVDPGKMAALGVVLEDVAAAIAGGNSFLPLGDLDGPHRATTLLADGQLLNAEAYRRLIIRYEGQSPLRVENIGEAVDSLQNYKFKRTFYQGERELPTVVVAVNPQPGGNTVAIADEIYKLLPSIHSELPSSLSMEEVYDRSRAVRDSIDEVQLTLIIAFLLVVLIIYLYLGRIRETVIPIFILPLSILGTFAAMDYLGYSLDNLSLMALILATGFIVDDAIVVIENIVRHVEMGQSPRVAAMVGSKEIGFTILSMNLSLIAVFIPLLFMEGLIGKILKEFAVTLTIITLLSGAISLSLTPMLCSIFIRPRKAEDGAEKGRSRGQRLNDAMIAYYRPSLQYVLRHPPLALLLLFLSIFCSGALFVLLPKDFMPSDDIGFFIAYTQAREGTSSERMEKYQQEVTEILTKDPNIETLVSLAPFQTYRNGLIFAQLKPAGERKPVAEVIHNLWGQTNRLVGINTFYKNIPLIDLSVGFQVKGAYQYIIQSLDEKKLYSSTGKFLEKMGELPGFLGMSSDLEVETPKLFLTIDRDKASAYGISARNIENALRLAYSGGKVSTILTPINQYDVILELNPLYQEKPSALELLYLRSETTDALVPLRAVADWKVGAGADSINHTNQFPSVTISFNLSPELPLSSAIEELDALAEEFLPEGVSGRVTGAAETFKNSVRSGALLILITLFAIYIVLGILYESFIHPLTILTTLPPAIIGGLLTLYFTGLPLSLYSFLGIILLIGIVKKNGIIIVDFALENIQEKGESPEQSIYEACIVRFRPIMMTTLTSIMGALPIAVGSGAGAEGRRPLGFVIIGGLLLAQLITLYITPVIYLYFEKLREKIWVRPS